MEIDDARRFLAEHDRGVLVARRRDGSPQITLVTPGVNAEGRAVISSRRNTFKVGNIRRDPRVSLLVMGERFHGGDYIQIDGTAEVIALPDSFDLLMEVYRRRLGDRMDPEATRRKILDEDRVLIRIDIERVGPQGRRSIRQAGRPS